MSTMALAIHVNCRTIPYANSPSNSRPAGGAHRHPRVSTLGPAAASWEVALRQMGGTDKEEQASKVATSTQVRPTEREECVG